MYFTQVQMACTIVDLIRSRGEKDLIKSTQKFKVGEIFERTYELKGSDTKESACNGRDSGSKTKAICSTIYMIW